MSPTVSPWWRLKEQGQTLSTLISSCSLNHHLYSGDTQLFLSFHPTQFISSIDQISSRITAKLLTLNSSKTEFLLIGLSKQLDKIHNSSLNTTHSAWNLGHIFDEHLTFPTQISSASKFCSLHPPIPRFQNSFHHRQFHCSLQSWLLQLSLSQPAQVSDHPAATDLELSCTCCCQSSQIQSHHSHPAVSAMAKDNRAHRIQAQEPYSYY